MRSALGSLSEVARDESEFRDASVWNVVSDRLEVRRAELGVRRFNGWVAALATAALILAALGIADQLENLRPQGDRQFAGNAQSLPANANMAGSDAEPTPTGSPRSQRVYQREDSGRIPFAIPVRQ